MLVTSDLKDIALLSVSLKALPNSTHWIVARMDYNSRMSQQFRGTTQQQRGKPAAKKEEDPNAFMILSDHELVAAFKDCSAEGMIPFGLADLQKPNAQHVFQVYEWFANALMAVMPDTVESMIRAATEQTCGDFADTIPPETRNLMGFYASLRRMMQVCAIHDFSLQDLFRPEHGRLVKHFSYLINFWRFRAEKMPIWDEQLTDAERVRDRHEAVYHQNQEMEAKIEEMRQRQVAMEGITKEKAKKNQDMKQKLRELNVQKEKTTERWEKVRAEKTRLTSLLEERTAASHAAKQECLKLKPYASSSSAALQAQLNDLSRGLSDDKAQIDVLERRSRALQSSAEAFTIVKTDVESCNKILEDVSASLTREDEEAAKAAKHRDTLTERSSNLREVERQEQLLARQLAKWNERTEKLRLASREKADAGRARMEELQVVHRQLTEERGEKGRDMEKRRIRIEQTERKMADLKENIENEVVAAQGEFLKMDAHIRLYIQEMDQAIEAAG